MDRRKHEGKKASNPEYSCMGRRKRHFIVGSANKAFAPPAGRTAFAPPALTQKGLTKKISQPFSHFADLHVDNRTYFSFSPSSFFSC